MLQKKVIMNHGEARNQFVKHLEFLCHLAIIFTPLRLVNCAG